MYLDEGHRNRSALVSRIRHECDLFRNLFRRSSSRLMRTLLALLASSGLVHPCTKIRTIVRAL